MPESLSIAKSFVAKYDYHQQECYQGRIQDFLKGRARAEIFINSGQKGAKNKPYVSSLPCYRLLRSFHIAKSFRTHVAKAKIT